MECISVTATIQDTVTTTVTVDTDAVNASAQLQGVISAAAQVVSGSVGAVASLVGDVVASAQIITGGVNGSPCPLILCVDGGSAFTTVYPPVNGLLNGGTA